MFNQKTLAQVESSYTVLTIIEFLGAHGWMNGSIIGWMMSGWKDGCMMLGQMDDVSLKQGSVTQLRGYMWLFSLLEMTLFGLLTRKVADRWSSTRPISLDQGSLKVEMGHLGPSE